MKTIKAFNSENITTIEGKFAKVGNTIVGYICESENGDGEYPYKHTVIVMDGEGRVASASRLQMSDNDSAFYDGFYPSYKSACLQLNISPKVE